MKGSAKKSKKKTKGGSKKNAKENSCKSMKSNDLEVATKLIQHQDNMLFLDTKENQIPAAKMSHSKHETNEDELNQAQPSGTVEVTNPVPEAQASKQQSKVGKIPPIILRDKNRFMELVRVLRETSMDIGLTRNKFEGVAFYPKNADDYKILRDIMEEGQYPYHSFSAPEELHLRTIIRGLKESVSEDEIRNELVNREYHPILVKRWRTRDGNMLPLIQVIVPKREKSILKMQELLHHKITVETQNKTGRPTQCFNCQLYGHSSKNCKAPPKCVKCAGDHESRSCKKDKEAPATCCNCQEQHTANFSGCAKRPLLRLISDLPRPTSPSASVPHIPCENQEDGELATKESLDTLNSKIEEIQKFLATFSNVILQAQEQPQ